MFMGDRIILRILLGTFFIFAISRVWQRFKSRSLAIAGFLFWTSLFGAGLLTMVFPDMTMLAANYLGIGRGVDFIIYVSIAILFYLVYRLYVFLDDIRSDIAKIIRELALKSPQKQH